jgi:hypothetical protein
MALTVLLFANTLFKMNKTILPSSALPGESKSTYRPQLQKLFTLNPSSIKSSEMGYGDKGIKTVSYKIGLHVKQILSNILESRQSSPLLRFCIAGNTLKND